MSTSSANGHSPLSQLPPLSDSRIALRVSPNAERAVRGGHPWLFADAIQRQSHQGQPGDLAVIFDRKGRFLAVGLYDPSSPIRVRILQAGAPAAIDAAWFRAKLAAAASIRQEIAAHTTGYRLVHGENDGLPGLVIDLYAQTAVLKLDTSAWVIHLPDILAGLAEVAAPVRVVLRLSRTLSKNQDHLYGLKDGIVLNGQPLSQPVIFTENGIRFEADVRHGQKTGFFLDQRDNRARVETLAAGKNILNVFAYTGGFSLYAARGGATHVVNVDNSQPALAAAMRNFRLNRQQEKIAAVEQELLLGDAFRTLQQLRDSRRRFHMVIIDPPSFARKQEQVSQALHAYDRLARLGLGVLHPGGILVTASCSSRVPADSFFGCVHKAAWAQKRPLREQARTFHPVDHPIGFKEGAYLKCLFSVAP